MRDCGLKYKAMFMTVYGVGLRISELCNLRIQDIDSENMRILVREGKESKYRYTLLSQTNLEILIEYFKAYRPNHPEGYLFVSPMTNDKYTVSEPEIAFYEKISYNSCRNRHCPKCLTSVKEKGIYNQKFDVLNVQYFHVVFTIPDELNKVVYYNQTKMYNVLFKAVSETLQQLGNDKKYLGAQIGFTSILHTWGQNLKDHPHIHCIVPAGGLDSLGKWRNSKKKFFIPVKVVSKVFRGKFIYYMKQEKLDFVKENEELKISQEFDKFISSLYAKDWVVYCKPPFKNANSVIEYLGRYTHRVAISNNRILNIDSGKVTFKWRDYRDNNKMKTMVLDADEFIRRFILHILPPRFMKIRHFGLLGNRNKTKKLTLCKSLTNTKVLTKENISPLEILKKKSGIDFNLCPICRIGHLIRPNLE